MKKIALSVMLFISVSSFAQISIGPRAGLNISTFQDAPGVSSITGLVAGGSFSYMFAGFFAVNVDALYSAEGAKYTLDINSFNLRYKTRMNYIRIPVYASASFGSETSTVRPKVMLGPSIGFLTGVKSEIELAGLSTEFGMDKSDFSSTDFGAIAGIGVDFKINEKTTFNIDGRYYFGATNILDVDLPVTDDIKNNVASITAGLMFVLQ
jgi:outer membrane protein W